MAVTLDNAVTEVLTRLGDTEGKVWTAARTKLHLQDGYDRFCERTKCLFDVFIIENLPPTGNWQTDLEKWFVQQKSGWGYTDDKLHTNDTTRGYGDDRAAGVAGVKVGGSYAQPAGMTRRGDGDFSVSGVTSYVRGGTLPDSVVGIVRVAFDKGDLMGISASRMNEIDPYWEERTGDPEWFINDSEGIYYLRVVPAADGAASYDTVDGSWGTLRYTDDTNVTTNTHGTNGFGILRYRTDCFPANGTWGTPRRIHPDDDNIKVDVFRIGRSLTDYTFELPEAYVKYVYYYAMSMLLNEDGPGQDLELAQHYLERFEMGIARLVKKEQQMMVEYEGALGKPKGAPMFGLGDPQASTDDMSAPT